MSVSRDDVELLFSRQIDELDGITGDADREVRVFLFLWMLHRVLELIEAKDVDVEMVSAFLEIAIEDIRQGVHSLFFSVA